MIYSNNQDNQYYIIVIIEQLYDELWLLMTDFEIKKDKMKQKYTRLRAKVFSLGNMYCPVMIFESQNPVR